MSSQSRSLRGGGCVSGVVVGRGCVCLYVLLCEGLLQKPGYDGKVLALVVCGEEDRVSVLGRHDDCCAVYVRWWKVVVLEVEKAEYRE